jgi:hypothetical protein
MASLEALTFKTAFLIMVISSRRVSEIQALSADKFFLTLNPQSAVLRVNPAFLPKTLTAAGLNSDVEIQAFYPDAVDQVGRLMGKNCPVRALHIYMRRTALLRQTSCLFVNPKPGRVRLGSAVSKRILASWLSQTIRSAYAHMGRDLPVLPQTGAHTCRKLSTSWLELSGASVQVIKKHTWISTQSFATFYRLDFASQQAQSGNNMLPLVMRTTLHSS